MIIGSAALHAGVVAAVVVAAMWHVEKLQVTSGTDITLSVAPPPGESAPPPAGRKLEVKSATKPIKVKPDVIVQPPKVVDPDPAPTGGGGDDTGDTDGPGGDGDDPTSTGTCTTGPCTTGGGGDGKPECKDGIDNDEDGLVDGADPACQAGRTYESEDPKTPPPIVAPGVAKGLRISGNEQIYPPETVRIEMLHQGKEVVQATVQLCVSARGTVDQLRFLKSTGYRAYDDELRREMREWRYKPYLVGGKPSPMCTVSMIVYRMKK